MKGNPKKIIQAIDHFGCNEQLLITIGRDKGRVMADLIREHKPRTMVELGGYVGYSAIFFADELRSACPGQRVHYWSLELHSEFAEIARELIEIAGLSDIVTVVVGFSSDSLRQLKKDGQLDQIDVLYLDHNEGELYVKDTSLGEELALFRPGSHIVADNCLIPGAPAYRAYVRGNAKFESKGVKGLTIPGELEVRRSITINAFPLTAVGRTGSDDSTIRNCCESLRKYAFGGCSDHMPCRTFAVPRNYVILQSRGKPSSQTLRPRTAEVCSRESADTSACRDCRFRILVLVCVVDRPKHAFLPISWTVTRSASKPRAFIRGLIQARSTSPCSLAIMITAF